jgi:hypothetical protein
MMLGSIPFLLIKPMGGSPVEMEEARAVVYCSLSEVRAFSIRWKGDRSSPRSSLATHTVLRVLPGVTSPSGRRARASARRARPPGEVPLG